MKKRILGGVVALLLSIGGSFAFNASPASAHWDGSAYSAFGCGATRPTAAYEVHEAHVVTMGVYDNGVSWLRSACAAKYLGETCNTSWISETRSWGGVNQYFVWAGYFGGC